MQTLLSNEAQVFNQLNPLKDIFNFFTPKKFCHRDKNKQNVSEIINALLNKNKYLIAKL